MENMENIEQFFDDTSKEISAMQTMFESYTKRLLSLTAEAEEIARRFKKEETDDGTEFEKEFNNFVKLLREDIDKTADFWNRVRDVVRNANPHQIDQTYTLSIKSFNMRARSIARASDSIDSAAVAFKKQTQKMNLQLNIWLLDAALADLSYTADKILFLSRSLEKIIEKKTIRKGW